jgi:hypothetical protein
MCVLRKRQSLVRCVKNQTLGCCGWFSTVMNLGVTEADVSKARLSEDCAKSVRLAEDLQRHAQAEIDRAAVLDKQLKDANKEIKVKNAMLEDQNDTIRKLKQTLSSLEEERAITEEGLREAVQDLQVVVEQGCFPLLLPSYCLVVTRAMSARAKAKVLRKTWKMPLRNAIKSRRSLRGFKLSWGVSATKKRSWKRNFVKQTRRVRPLWSPPKPKRPMSLCRLKPCHSSASSLPPRTLR